MSGYCIGKYLLSPERAANLCVVWGNNRDYCGEYIVKVF